MKSYQNRHLGAGGDFLCPYRRWGGSGYPGSASPTPPANTGKGGERRPSPHSAAWVRTMSASCPLFRFSLYKYFIYNVLFILIYFFAKKEEKRTETRQTLVPQRFPGVHFFSSLSSFVCRGGREHGLGGTGRGADIRSMQRDGHDCIHGL